MRKRTSIVVRLFVMLVMSLGLATLTSSPAAAQTSTTGTCQSIVGGNINQSPTQCTLVVEADGQCQLIDEEGISQNVEICGVEGCPRQIILENGDIFQFNCGGGAAATTAPATATNVPATATNVPATTVPATTVPGTNVPATDVPATNVPGTDVPATNVPATNVPATDVPDGGQAEEEEEVSVLPETGQGPTSGQSSSATMLLLGAMAMVMTLAAVGLHVRSKN